METTRRDIENLIDDTLHSVWECEGDNCGCRVLLADGLDGAFVGLSGDGVAIYDINKCIEILMKNTEGEEDPYVTAWEHFWYNVAGAYVGEKTPIWAYVL
jgi:hypothetical protein